MILTLEWLKVKIIFSLDLAEPVSETRTTQPTKNLKINVILTFLFTLEKLRFILICLMEMREINFKIFSGMDLWSLLFMPYFFQN